MNNDNLVVQKVIETIHQHKMIEKGDKILVAVSGGADSVCLLNVLCSIKKSFGFDVCCAHLNHGLRGAAADGDEQFVVSLCERLKVPVYTKKVDVADLAKTQKLTEEEAGRLARYEFFDELKKKHKITKIATAHNKNDNAETVLMRILRGTGIDGLKGISFVREDGVIRPLLDVSRPEIEKYCEENALTFCTDATNADNEYTRNKIRNVLLPFLEKEFNTGITDSLCRLAENATADAEFLEGYAHRLYARLRSPLPRSKPVDLHIESLSLVDKAVASRIIRIAATEATDGVVKLEKKHIDDVFELMTKQTGATIDLPFGLDAAVNYGWLSFETEESKTAEDDESGFFSAVEPLQTVYIEALKKSVRLRIENSKDYKCKVNETAVDYALLEGQPLFLRSRRSGDKMVWFPDGRTKKIKNILIDAKIPKKDREKIPLLCTGSEVLAIIGSRVSEKYKPTDKTERILVIEYGTTDESQGVD